MPETDELPLLLRMRTLLSMPNHRRAAEMLSDFETGRTDHVEDVHLRSGAPLDPIGGEDSGGTYFLCGDGDDEQRPVLHADSEGNATYIGLNLRWALELLLSPVHHGVMAVQHRRDAGLDVLAARAEEYAAEQWADLLDVYAEKGITVTTEEDLDDDLDDYEYRSSDEALYEWVQDVLDGEDSLEVSDDWDGEYPPLSAAEISRLLLSRLGLERRTTAELLAHLRECAEFTRANPGFALVNSAEGNIYRM
ncbi:hypothetical protein CLV63_11684 [Murinocardiopsis flavida]|uniref:Uncharacterized protein n=1 Tax=Murinocardiopsis flavida TaxID=645275 RepID=A0A2P8D907_9ACTN|nr:hypothetical protein [Murinocardiopsis flavida]PSK93677.1 hypothetical protein CLV63_11684 [Murinocardiopsis flavida]